MAFNFRVATFNMENLFSRARVLNLEDKSQASAILAEIARLERLLGKSAYGPTDKAEILSLTNSLARYVQVREDRGKLFSGSGANKKVSASGASAWDGVVVFQRAEIKEMARESTADVVRAVKADVLCAVEVEDRGTLRDFNRQGLKTRRFPYPMVIDGNDPRGIDVGVLSRFPIVSLRTHIFDRTPAGIIFSRDCLEVELLLPDGRPLHLLCNHLKSQGYGSPAANQAKRRRQAARIREILARYNPADDRVIVAGDLNDDPGSSALAPLLDPADSQNQARLHDVLEFKFGANAAGRWTYRRGSRSSQLDYLLVSEPLRAALQDAGVERRGMSGVPGVTPFPSVTSKATAASDHAAVWAEFAF